MFRRILRLFQRYIAQHLELIGPEFPLISVPGSLPGKVSDFRLSGKRLLLKLDTSATRAELLHGGEKWLGRRVSDQAGAQIVFDVPMLSGPADIGLHFGKLVSNTPIPMFSRSQFMWACLGIVPQFFWAGVRALPMALRWLWHHDPMAKARVKRILGLGGISDAMPLNDDIFSVKIESNTGKLVKNTATIILPIHNAFDLLPEVLDRVLRHSDLPWHLIVIEDCSSDPKVRPFLRQWVAKQCQTHRITLIENDQNLGFVHSVNRGFDCAARDFGAPVVLLNSDAFVPAGWLSRLLRPLIEDPNIASVTPMSNDAELMSVPVICHGTALQSGDGDRIDAIARKFSPAVVPQLPTGVGFCMALSAKFLALESRFDTVFGVGYGEEVDWCRKTRARGGRHVVVPGLFVEHRAGTSFGQERKRTLLHRNDAVILRRYPEFDGEVQTALRDDPLLTPRLALGLAWAAIRGDRAGQAVPVYLAHSLGGGAEAYLRERLAGDVKNIGAAVVLRVGGLMRWQLEVHTNDGVTRGATDNFALIERLLEPLSNRRVIYSCGVGDPDPMSLPDLICRLGQGHQIEVLIHDYLPLSPSYTLLNDKGVYHDVVATDFEKWRNAWGRMMMQADDVVVFSRSSQRLVAKCYPSVKQVLRPHQLLAPIPSLVGRKMAKPKRPVIGVLGNIGAHKGAGILVELSARLAQSHAAGLVLIGDLDPTYALAKPAKVHGEYRLADLGGLVARYGVTCWLIPSIWPEPFSYATHEALATGLPVICFDLGAQGDAVARASNGEVVPLRDGQPDWEALMAIVAGSGP